jgi:branched-chain amino acid aminotransferase
LSRVLKFDSLQIFGAGTAAIVSPVERIHYKGQDYKIPLGLKPTNTCGELAQRLADEIQAIQYGEKSHEWSVTIQ